MADYYPLIARAVSGLDKNTGENRRALYDRARVALVAQLRGVQPALEEPDITRERLALEEAIRKVEAETAKRVRADTPEPEEPSLRDRGLRDFRETVAEAEGLGSASAEAKRAAHATYEAMPVEPRASSRTFQPNLRRLASLRLPMRRRRPRLAQRRHRVPLTMMTISIRVPHGLMSG